MKSLMTNVAVALSGAVIVCGCGDNGSAIHEESSVSARPAKTASASAMSAKPVSISTSASESGKDISVNVDIKIDKVRAAIKT